MIWHIALGGLRWNRVQLKRKLSEMRFLIDVRVDSINASIKRIDSSSQSSKHIVGKVGSQNTTVIPFIEE